MRLQQRVLDRWHFTAVSVIQGGRITCQDTHSAGHARGTPATEMIRTRAYVRWRVAGTVAELPGSASMANLHG